ncbi:hypothetical protein [Antarctobacter sp.]|uniref:hypothetical protein n=1 Tax=Antarctobacter sp. TaxID=1872577 RepID=UPI002B279FFA|nr:hypothetical protein [Antarctobacter sp.]
MPEDTFKFKELDSYFNLVEGRAATAPAEAVFTIEEFANRIAQSALLAHLEPPSEAAIRAMLESIAEGSDDPTGPTEQIDYVPGDEFWL